MSLVKKIMTEFVAKMYTNRKKYKQLAVERCKGIRKCSVAKKLTFDDFKSWLFDGQTTYREKMLFENKKLECK